MVTLQIRQKFLIFLPNNHELALQVLLKWGLLKGHSVLPKSVNEERIRANFELNFEMTREAVEKLDSVGLVKKYGWNPVDVL